MEVQQVAALLWPQLSNTVEKQMARKPDEAVPWLSKATNHVSLIWSGPCDAVCA